MTSLPHIGAMQFQGKTYPETLGFAQRFAGPNGHVATLPEIFSARAVSPMSALVWNNYYTTSSSEFFGVSRGGSEIVIVAHGNGPLLDGAALSIAYSPVYGRARTEGFITPKMFRKLESGDYGDVEIIDFAHVRNAYKNPWFEYVTVEQAANDPMLKARCGADWQTVLEKLQEETQQEFGRKNSGPALVVMSEGATGYWQKESRETMPYGHLLGVSRTYCLYHGRNSSISIDVKLHERSNSLRFIGVRQGADLSKLHHGPELLERKKERLLRPYERDSELPRLMTLEQFESGWFSCRPKEGEALDTGWPEHPVTSMTNVGKVGKLVSPHSHFLRYDVAQLVWDAPQEANAYYLGEPKRITVDGEAAIEAPVHYCRVTVDATRKCVTEEELKDFELQMLLLEQLP